jgi:hypothetical protein
MNEGRFTTTLFCDDVRQEVGNKLSFMGVYNGGQLLLEKIPGVLPKLCGHVVAHTPIDKPFRALSFKAFSGDELLGSMDISPADLEKMRGQMPREVDVRMVAVGAILTFSPFVVAEPMVLRAVVATEEGELPPNRLWIRAQESASAVAAEVKQAAVAH